MSLLSTNFGGFDLHRPAQVISWSAFVQALQEGSTMAVMKKHGQESRY